MAIIVTNSMNIDISPNNENVRIYVVGYMGEFGYFITNQSSTHSVWIVNPNDPANPVITVYPQCSTMASRKHEILAIRAGLLAVSRTPDTDKVSKITVLINVVDH